MLKPRLAPHVAALFSGTIVLLVLVAVFGYRSTLQAERQRFEVLHTYEVIEQLQSVLSDLKDVQAAQRGYVITGQIDYLAPYSVAVPRIAETRGKLEKSLAANPEQHRRLGEVLAEADKRLALAEQIINAYQKDGEAAAVALVRAGSGKREMDHIRALIAEMIGIEHRQLVERQRRAEDAAQRIALIGLLGLLICAAVLTAVFVMIRGENHLRQRTQRSLEESLDTMHRMAGDAESIGRLGDYLRSSRRIDEAYEICARSLPHVLPGSAGAIAVFDEHHESLKVVSAWGEAASLAVDQVIDADGCWALRRGQRHHSHEEGEAPSCTHRLPNPLDSLCLPMQAHGETLGVFLVDPRDASAAGVLRLERVVEQVSIGIASLRTQQRIWEQSVRDPMTELFNRRYAEPTMQRELARARRENRAVSVLLLDVDHFKRVNDEHGHDAGDAVLRKVATLLKGSVRQQDIACRYGGEEFLLVLPGCRLAEAEAWADRLRARLASTSIALPSGRKHQVTASLGVACFPEHGTDGPALVSAADAALYAAKDAGRNRVVTASSDAAILARTMEVRALKDLGYEESGSAAQTA